MYIYLDGTYYHIKVSGSGTPLLCMHGFSEDNSTWDFLSLDGYCLYKIDLIGHGKSDKPESLYYYKTQTIIKHLHRVMGFIVKNNEELQRGTGDSSFYIDTDNNYFDHKSSPYSILAYSMGGRLALAYTLEYEAEIEALILESSSYGQEEEARTAFIKRDTILADTIAKNGIEWFEDYWSQLEIFSTQRSLPIEIQREISRRRLQNKSHSLAKTLEGSGQGVFPCLKDELKKLSLPVLHISGEKDEKYAKIGEILQGLNSSFYNIVIKEAGHNVHIEKEKDFKEIVSTFLKNKTT